MGKHGDLDGKIAILGAIRAAASRTRDDVTRAREGAFTLRTRRGAREVFMCDVIAERLLEDVLRLLEDVLRFVEEHEADSNV